MALGHLTASAGTHFGPPEFKVPTIGNRFICSLLIGLQPPLAGYPPGSLCPLRSHSSHMPRSCPTPVESWTLAIDASFDTGFSITLLDLLPHFLLRGYINLQAFAKRPVACVILSLSRPAVRLRIQNALRAWQSVYASIMLFPHPLAVASGNIFGNAVSSAVFRWVS